MTKFGVLHHCLSYARHVLTAWNTTGEAIHSPFLFHIVRFVMRDENSYYRFADIERRRAYLQACEDEIEMLDFGSQGAPGGRPVTRRVSLIARQHLESPRVGQLLFRLTLFLGQHLKRPLNVLELGTSFGITTAYLAAADSRNSVTTMEGSEAVLKVAQGVWRALDLENIQWVQGNIDDTLFTYTRDWDLVFVDANHTYDATMRYADFLLPRMTEKGVIVLDDIHHSAQMEQAWKELTDDERVTTTMDLYHVGLLFVDPHYLKRHYRIRL